MDQRWYMRARAGESGEQVVVAEDAEPSLALIQLAQNIFGEHHPHGGLRTRCRVGGPQLRVRIPNHLPGQPQRVFAGQHRFARRRTEVRQVQVVDDFGDQVVEAFHEGHPGVGVPGDAQRSEHQMTELVGGGDRRGVETRECIAQTFSAGGELGR